MKINVEFNYTDVPVLCTDPERPGICVGLLILLEDTFSGRVFIQDGRYNDGEFEVYDLHGSPEALPDDVEVIGWRPQELYWKEARGL